MPKTKNELPKLLTIKQAVAVLNVHVETFLYQQLKSDVLNWRQQGYPSSYPAITTILQHNQNNFLRKAQFEALET